jgi:hypothetical protein
MVLAMMNFYDINIYNMLTQQLEKSLHGSPDRRRIVDQGDPDVGRAGINASVTQARQIGPR